MESITVDEKRKTYADYQRLKEGDPCQLIGGMFVMSPSPSVSHQRVLIKIAGKLMKLEEKGLGEVLTAPMDVYFSDTEVYQPDVMFISKERSFIIEKNIINGAPDLIFEVISPGTGNYDLKVKMKTYEAAGVREYWVIDPEKRSAERYVNHDGVFESHGRVIETGRLASKIFPDFSLEAGELFG